jgi:hypothetical protein
MKALKRPIILFTLVLLLSLIIYLFRSFFFSNLVDPLSRILWLGFRSFRAIDQNVIWIILVAMVFIAGILMIPGDKQFNLRSSYSYSNKSKPSEDRVTFWKHQFQMAEKNVESRLSLQQNLEELSVSIYELNEDDQRQQISLPKYKMIPWQLVSEKWLNLFKRIMSKEGKFMDGTLERSINQYLDSMESLMEIQNDQSSTDTK